MSESFINSIPGQQRNISFNPISNVPVGTNAIGTQPKQPEPLPKPPVENVVEKSLLAQLDVLLLHAAKKATTVVKTETVMQVLDSINLDDDSKSAIEELANRINENLASLPDYTGRDIAEVFQSVDGKLQWKDDTFIGMLMNDLMNDCADYSQKLQDIINTHPGAKGLNILEEAMLQSDRRASELTEEMHQSEERALRGRVPEEEAAEEMLHCIQNSIDIHITYLIYTDFNGLQSCGAGLARKARVLSQSD